MVFHYLQKNFTVFSNKRKNVRSDFKTLYIFCLFSYFQDKFCDYTNKKCNFVKKRLKTATNDNFLVLNKKCHRITRVFVVPLPVFIPLHYSYSYLKIHFYKLSFFHATY